MATEVFFFFFVFLFFCFFVFFLVFLFVALRTPQEALKRYFSECSILALEKRYLEKDLFN